MNEFDVHEALNNVARSIGQEALDEIRSGEVDVSKMMRCQKTLEEDEIAAMVRIVWEGKHIPADYSEAKRNHVWLRSIIYILINQKCGRRLADFETLRMNQWQVKRLPHLGPSKCVGIGATLLDTKEGKIAMSKRPLDRIKDDQYMLLMVRAKDRLRCALGATAVGLVMYNQLHDLLLTVKTDCQALLADPINYKPRFWKMHFMPGGHDAYNAAGDQSIRNDVSRALDAAGISKVMVKCHIFRTIMLTDLADLGVPLEDASALAGCKTAHNTAASYSRSGARVKPLLPLLGYGENPREDFECPRAGERSDIPDVLIEAVGPGYKETREWAQKVADKLKITGPLQLCDVWEVAAQVFLEDARAGLDEFPMLPPYKDCRAFKLPEWVSYKTAEDERERKRAAEYAERNAKYTKEEVAVMIRKVASEAATAAVKDTLTSLGFGVGGGVMIGGFGGVNGGVAVSSSLASASTSTMAPGVNGSGDFIITRGTTREQVVAVFGEPPLLGASLSNINVAFHKWCTDITPYYRKLEAANGGRSVPWQLLFGGDNGQKILLHRSRYFFVYLCQLAKKHGIIPSQVEQLLEEKLLPALKKLMKTKFDNKTLDKAAFIKDVFHFINPTCTSTNSSYIDPVDVRKALVSVGLPDPLTV